MQKISWETFLADAFCEGLRIILFIFGGVLQKISWTPVISQMHSVTSCCHLLPFVWQGAEDLFWASSPRRVHCAHEVVCLISRDKKPSSPIHHGACLGHGDCDQGAPRPSCLAVLVSCSRPSFRSMRCLSSCRNSSNRASDMPHPGVLYANGSPGGLPNRLSFL